jgi:PAS domain S-box-containing protein
MRSDPRDPGRPPEAPDIPTSTVGVESAPVDEFGAIVSSSDDAILSKDREGIITSWNPAAEKMYGWTAEEAIGRPISILIPEHRRGEEMIILDKVLAGDRVDHYRTERVAKDGHHLVVSLTISPVRNEEGEIVRASVIARDVTDRERSLALASHLQSLTSALARESTPERTIEVLLEQAVAAVAADAGAVGVISSSGEEIELTGSHGHGFNPQESDRWATFGIEDDLPMSEVIRNGRPVWSTSGEELRRRFTGIGDTRVRYSALAVVPLSVGERPFGAMSLSFATDRGFDAEEQAFLLAVAQQAAYAIDRTRLFEAERAAAEKVRFLAEASRLLSESLDPDTLLNRLAQLTVEYMSDWCGIELIGDDGELRNVAVAHVDPDQVRLARELRQRYPIDPEAATGVPRVIRTGLPELYPEVPDELLAEGAVDEEHLRLMRELGLESAMVVPLVARGRALGALTLVSSDPERHYDEEDLNLAGDLARRAALAIDNAMLYHREHEAAVILQRALLPQSLPQMGGIEFAARYEPAAVGLEVGGDWYEVVPRDDGTIGVVMGDIAGRGIHAAAVMGRVRPALRAYVLDGYGPVEAVQRLHRLIREAEAAEMTTVFQLHFDPSASRAEYVRAGHPPALLRLPDGEVTELAGDGSPPLGVFDEVDFTAQAVEIPPGSLLLLYTDGLIERRGEDLVIGLTRLKELLAEAPAGAAAAVDWLAEQVSADQIPDDVAILAMATSNGSASG